MGCDIHLYVERREGDEWVTTLGPCNRCDMYGSEPCWKCQRDEVYDKDQNDWIVIDLPTERHGVHEDWLYGGRNYNLFAILADVRNGRGFGGIPTGAGFDPISVPRGVPVDASEFYRKLVEKWEADGHSHSYYLLPELLEYDWDAKTSALVYDFLRPEDYVKFRDEGRIISGSFEMISHVHFTSGGGVEASYNARISHEAMDQGIEDGTIVVRDLQPEYTDTNSGRRMMRWIEKEEQYTPEQRPKTAALVKYSYRECVSDYWFECLEKARELGDPADTRLVFFFDN